MSDNPGTAGAHDEDDEEEFYPPENFAMVSARILLSLTAMPEGFNVLYCYIVRWEAFMSA
jgi:hypothetical protein